MTKTVAHVSVTARPGPPPPRPTPRFDGTLTTWHDDRGFGFIDVDRGSSRLFVHISAFPSDSARPSEGVRLDFEIERAENGRSRAANVGRLGEPTNPTHFGSIATGDQRDTQIVVSLAVFAGFIGVLATLTAHWQVPDWIFALYGVASLSAFIGYYMDKRAAQARQWRVREGTLLALGLLGGWPGALLAQQLLRHKTRKVTFRRAFWGTVFLNVAALVAFTSPSWTTVLHTTPY